MCPLRLHACVTSVLGTALLAAVAATPAESAAPARTPASVGLTLERASLDGRSLKAEVVATRTLRLRFVVRTGRTTRGSAVRTVRKGKHTLRIRILSRPLRGAASLRLTASRTTRPKRSGAATYRLPFVRTRAPVGGTSTPVPLPGDPAAPGPVAAPAPTTTDPATPPPAPSPAAPDTAPVVAPQVILAAGATTIAENAPPTPVDRTADVTSQTPDLTSATARLAAGGDPGDRLAVTAPPGTTATYDDASRTLTLSGVATRSAYRDALRALTFAGTSDVPTTSKQVAFQVRDTNGTSSAVATKALTITPVDDPRRAVADTATVAEDAAATVLDVLANDVDPDGPPGAAPRVLSATDPARGTVDTSAGTSLTYRPDPGLCGTDTFSYTITGGTSATVTVSVTCVNDPPVVVAGGTLTYVENAAPTPLHPAVTVTDQDSSLRGARVSFTLGGQVEDLLAWADNDPTDAITRNAAQSTAAVVVLQGTGTPAQYQAALRAVTYANVSDAPSTASRTVAFSVTDTGGAAAAATRSITVSPVDDPPTAVADSATVLEDGGQRVIGVLANDTDPDGGPRAVTAVGPAAHGTTALVGTEVRYTPAANYCGPDSFGYTITGGRTANVAVTVTCVNDAPIADDETTSAGIGGTTLVLDRPGGGAPPVPSHPHRVVTLDLLAGDTDVDSATLSLVPATDQATDDGSRVDIEADGDVVVRSAPGSCLDRTDSFTYSVTDGQATDQGQVTIGYAECVRYVSNNASGNAGTADAPFDTLAQAEAASGPGNTVFVFTGDGTTAGLGGDGYALAAGERLVGQPAGLTIDPDGAGPQAPVVLAAATAGARPVLTATGADVVALDDGNEVRGLLLDPQGAGGAIAGGAGDAGGLIADVALRDLDVPGTQPGLELDGTAGTWSVVRSAFGTQGATGVRLQSAGIVDFDDVRIDTVGARGLDAAATNLATSRFSSISVSGSPTGAVRLADTTGNPRLGDGVGTDLALQTTAGSAPALDLTNANGVVVDAAGTDTLSATGGPALRLTARPATLTFDSASSTGSDGAGLLLSGAGDGIVNISGGTIAGAALAAVDISGGAGTVLYGGNVADGPGASVRVTGRTGGTVTLSGAIADGTDAGGGIVVGPSTGGTTTFSGTSKVLRTGPSTAVDLQTGAAHAVAFTGGGLQLDATTGRGLSATAGGTVTVTGAGNRIATTTGTALHVVGATIGPARLTFERLSSAGAVNGVVLQGTGAQGLTVTGAGGTCTSSATCTGGTIRGSTGDGVRLTDVADVTLTGLLVDGGGESAIKGLRVRDLRLSGVVADDNGDDPGDVGIDLQELTGTAGFTNVRATRSELANVRIANTSGTLALSVTGGAFSQLGATSGANAFLLDARGTAIVSRADVQGATFADNGLARGLTVQAQEGARVGSTATPFAVRAATFARNGLHASFEQGGDADLAFRLTESSLTAAAPSHAVNVFSSSAATGGAIRGRIEANTIGTAGVAGSGSTAGNGIRALVQGATTARLAIVGNVVRQTPQARGIDVQLLGPTTAAAAPRGEVAVRNNTVTPNDTSGFPLAAIYLGADAQGGGPGVGRFDVRGNTVPAGASTDAQPAFLVVDRVVAAAGCEVVHDGTPSATAAQEVQSVTTGSASASSACTQVAGPLEATP